jgi:curved DNA-binding protein CbpA
MNSPAFSTDWLKKFTDPYAILGVSVAADERRILKRYRQVAKYLHPDMQFNQPEEQQQFVSEVLTKLVNPAYQRLKQEKGRNEVLATLRFKVRRLSRENHLLPNSEAGKKLLTVPEPEIDVFYEQALEKFCKGQFTSLKTFEVNTYRIGELNLVYLKRKMGDPVIREKRTGLVAASTVTTSAVPATEARTEEQPATINYADRHFRRAQEYIKAKNINAAIQELKDALRLEPKNSNYHCLLGQAYLLNQLPGMAKVHIKQALILNPNQPVAQKYARQLKIDLSKSSPHQQTGHPSRSPTDSHKGKGKGSLFGGLFSKH